MLVPSGIVAKGEFYDNTPAPGGSMNRSQVKVAANLNGSVRYVWPNDAMNGFVIEGFDQDQIDISFSNLPSGNSRNVIKANILFNNVTPALSGSQCRNPFC
jgi:hypothetical protein